MKTQFPKSRVKRLVAALISSALALFLGQTYYAKAEGSFIEQAPATGAEDCGLSTATHFLKALSDHTVEQTPTYRLTIAENFLTVCPHRLEAERAHEVAASAALSSGEYAKAADHYDILLETKRTIKSVERLKASLAYKMAGQSKASRLARNQAVYDWLQDIHDNTDAALSVSHTRNGTIYRALFADTGETDDVAAVWFGVPRSDEMPRVVVQHNDAQRAAWAALRDGATPEDYYVLESYGCRDRDVLLYTTTPFAPKTQNKRIEHHINKLMGLREDLSRLEERGGSCTQLSRGLYVPKSPKTSAALAQ